MMPLLSCAQAGAYDSEVGDSARLAEGTLMEIAATRLWDTLAGLLPKCAPSTGRRRGPVLAAVCGSGNNAGDTLAVLRHAAFAGYTHCVAILCRDDLGPLASVHAASLRAIGVPLLSWKDNNSECFALLESSGMILDALAGSGLSGSLRGSALDIALFLESLPRMRDGGPPIVSIDLPSGLGDGIDSKSFCVRADWTLSVEPRKTCLYIPAFRGCCGEILSVEGVFPVEGRPSGTAELLESADIAGIVPRDDPTLYKGSRGRLAIFAGGIGTTGAASLCARASLAAGAGYSALYCDHEIRDVLASRLEEIMVRTLPSGSGEFRPQLWDAILAGPGWAETEENAERLEVLLSFGLPAVIDAGAIGMYGRLVRKGFRPSAPVLLTPHAGECSRLCGLPVGEILAAPESILKKTATELSACIVFKSHVTWIFSPDGAIHIWEGMESGLGTAGSGDVLAGLAGGLLARLITLEHACFQSGSGTAGEKTVSNSALNAACAAVIAHGTAGKSLRRRKGWYTAGSLIAEAARILGKAGPVAG